MEKTAQEPEIAHRRGLGLHISDISKLCLMDLFVCTPSNVFEEQWRVEEAVLIGPRQSVIEIGLAKSRDKLKPKRQSMALKCGTAVCEHR